MPMVSKADAIVTATINLAQVVKGKMEPNIGGESIEQLKKLIDMLNQTTTLTKGTWAEQQSKNISTNHEQTRMKDQEQDPQSQTHLFQGFPH